MKLPAQTITPREEARLTRWIMALDEVLPIYTKRSYEGHVLKRDERGWLLVLKASGRGGRYVAFYNGHRPWVCWLALAFDMKRGRIRWRKDNPPPDMGA